MIGSAQALQSELDQEAQATRRVLERVPAEKLAWRPHPKAMTLGQLALHVAKVPGDLANLSTLDGIDGETVDFEPPSPPTSRRSFRRSSRVSPGRARCSPRSTNEPPPAVSA